MKRLVTMNGLARTLSLEGNVFEFDGLRGELDWREVEPGVYQVLLEGESFTVTLAGNGVAYAGGRQFEVEVVDPRDAIANGAGRESSGQVKVTAPMPGRIVRLLVAAGDPVEAGQGLVVVEAMKMQNEMKAPRAGTVTSVKTKEGAAVAAGDVLVVLA